MTITPVRGGASITHQLSHPCCLKAALSTRIEGSTAVVLEAITGTPCRCMCASTLRTAIALTPGQWTVAVDLEQNGRVERVAESTLDVLPR